ncbi:MAG: restriction endonuclease subunit S [Bacteroidales bacterium]|nr:restriction endonuclease subunit S [Bacteroidales bacterium]
MKNYPTYNAYKPSGAEWLGEIPEHWKLTRLGLLLTPVSDRNRLDLPLLSITREKGVILRDLDDEDENHNFIPDDLSNYKVLKAGQFGMNKMKAWQGSYGISDFDGIVSPAYFIFNLHDKVRPEYFHKAIRSKLYVSFFGSASDGVRIGQWDLSKERMTQIPFVIPPKAEQTAIAQFLDQKTALIDKAIAIKQKQIALLKERRQILIHRAVTRGLNPNVKMKDSGVEWIGMIPEGWEVKRLKYVANVVLGKMICNEDKGNYKLKPYLKSKNIQWLNVDVSTVDEMWFSIKEMNDYRLKKGDLVLSEGGEVGKTCIWNNELNECYIQNSAHKITFFKENIQEYFLYLFYTTGKMGFFDAIVNKVSIGHLTKDKLINIKIIKPSEKEQIAIANYIEKASKRIATAITLKEKEIEKLKEYKATLIDSVVRGKIKVC